MLLPHLLIYTYVFPGSMNFGFTAMMMGFLLLTPLVWTPEHIGVGVERCSASWGAGGLVALAWSPAVIFPASHDEYLLTGLLILVLLQSQTTHVEGTGSDNGI